MSFGIQVINRNSFLQIDGTHTSYVRASEGTAAMGTNETVIAWPPNVSSYPMVFVRPLTANRTIFGRVDPNTRRIHVTQLLGGTFAYRIYAPSPQVPESGDTHGIRVFMTNGQVAFSSRHRHGRVLNTVRSDAVSVSFSLSAPAGQAAWVLLNSLTANSLRALLSVGPRATFGAVGTNTFSVASGDQPGAPIDGLVLGNKLYALEV